MEEILKRAANPWRVPKLEKVFQQLGTLAQRQKTKQAKADATGGVTTDRLGQIAHDEELVRQVLGLFGINYDGLIAMDGKSSYHQAIGANPELAQQVATADKPVLEALKAAITYQPYAEFTAKYGNTPEAIKQSLQAELQAQGDAQNQTAQAAGAAVPAPRPAVGPVFSGYAGSGRTQPQARKKDDLASLFGR